MVVQTTLDSAIHWKNHFPLDKYLGNRYPLDRDLSGGYKHHPPFEQLGPELQELYGQVDQGIEVYKSNYCCHYFSLFFFGGGWGGGGGGEEVTFY